MGTAGRVIHCCAEVWIIFLYFIFGLLLPARDVEELEPITGSIGHKARAHPGWDASLS